ncbi:MAG: DUF1853 family protein [Massilia sp.]
MSAPADTYQAHFARRWGHLRRPHVRALAWLIDAPDLLDPHDPGWHGQIATLGAASSAVAAWLASLDADPAALDASLGEKPYTRLGLYAEKLMAFYFAEQGRLVAHSLQVRASRNDTIGEFDFLLDAGADGLEHIELATKFYLLQGSSAQRFDNLIGPNLADSLGAKMRKIVGKQLALGEHPAAQALLPRPVVKAAALVKGWLFYPAASEAPLAGIGAAHCRGFWCALDEIAQRDDDAFVVLPRLQWLAPWRGAAPVLDRAGLKGELAGMPGPVLVAAVRPSGAGFEETARGFIVPDDWRARAAARSA